MQSSGRNDARCSPPIGPRRYRSRPHRPRPQSRRGVTAGLIVPGADEQTAFAERACAAGSILTAHGAQSVLSLVHPSEFYSPWCRRIVEAATGRAVTGLGGSLGRTAAVSAL